MSNETLRAQLVSELQLAIEEVARLSEMITVLRATHSANEGKLVELSSEWTTANNRAAALRQEVQSLDDVDD